MEKNSGIKITGGKVVVGSMISGEGNSVHLTNVDIPLQNAESGTNVLKDAESAATADIASQKIEATSEKDAAMDKTGTGYFARCLRFFGIANKVNIFSDFIRNMKKIFDGFT